MELSSINVGHRERLQGHHFNGYTGIHKRPVEGPVRVFESGLDADAVVDTRHHGGPDQAVYAYRQEDYVWWSRELGHDLAPGTFGENLTLTGLPEPGLAIGSRMLFSQVILEVTAPRIPCNTLAQRMGDAGFVKRFMQAQRPGVYLRVIRAGELVAGETFTVTPFDGPQVSTVDVFRVWHKKLDETELRRFLSVPIDLRSRAYLEGKLAELTG